MTKKHNREEVLALAVRIWAEDDDGGGFESAIKAAEYFLDELEGQGYVKESAPSAFAGLSPELIGAIGAMGLTGALASDFGMKASQFEEARNPGPKFVAGNKVMLDKLTPAVVKVLHVDKGEYFYELSIAPGVLYPEVRLWELTQ